VETTVRYYDDSHILVTLYFSFQIIVQVFDTVVGDDSMRLGHIFIFLATFLLVAYVMSYFVYFIINCYLAWSFREKFKNPKKLEKPKIGKKIENLKTPKNLKTLKTLKTKCQFSISCNVSMNLFGVIFQDLMIIVLN